MITRRLALLRFATGSAVAAATAATAAVMQIPKSEPADSREPFKTPIEYLFAMQAIGWTSVAMFHTTRSGHIIRMGVKEAAPDQEWVMRTWSKLHAIQMRCPMSGTADIPQLDWWKEVWQFLYDCGLREDVTPKCVIDTRSDDGGEA